MMWDLGLICIPLRILKEKLVLYHHISCLPQTALAKMMMKEQERLNFPSLRDEVVHFLAKFEVTEVSAYSKKEWKYFIKEKIEQLNREFLVEWCQKYKKLDHLSLSIEEFGMKEYFSILSLDQARVKFRERAKCLKTCKLHYPSDWLNIKTMFKCRHCDDVDSGDGHWKICMGYKHLREDRNLDDIFQLINYYQDVIRMRDEDEQ